MSKGYGATSLIGGGVGALDAIPIADLSDGDACTVYTSSGAYHYHLNATSGAAENSPYVIKPDDVGAGDQRWILLTPQAPFSHIKAETNSGQSIPGATHTTIIFEDETEDVLGEYNAGTGIFTALYTGWYAINASIIFQSSAWVATNFLQLGIEGSVTKRSGKVSIQATTTDVFGTSIGTVIKLTATQTAYITGYHTRGSATLLETNVVWNWLTIDRIA